MECDSFAQPEPEASALALRTMTAAWYWQAISAPRGRAMNSAHGATSWPDVSIDAESSWVSGETMRGGSWPAVL
jgi:hypothetical protein